jgi:hypothetical protein
MALEAQLAPITTDDITARTGRMRADGVPSIWFSDRRSVPWLGVVPSVRLARPDDGEGLAVTAGLEKFRRCNCGGPCPPTEEYRWETVSATLPQFLGWVFTGRVIACSTRGRMVWTAARYAQAASEYEERMCRIEAAIRQGQLRDLARHLARYPARQKAMTMRAATAIAAAVVKGD